MLVCTMVSEHPKPNPDIAGIGVRIVMVLSKNRIFIMHANATVGQSLDLGFLL